ncbi:MAG: hypothetical protein ACXWUG_08060 [Polyangiales bacterium]
MRWSVVAPGFGGFLAMYGISATIGYAGMHEGAAVAAVPVAGPFLAMHTGDDHVLYAVLGAGQIIGLGVGVAGLLIPKKQLVPDAPRASELRVVPVASRAMTGLVLVESF